MASLVACPSCSTHVRATESTCPHCDSGIRNERGAMVRTAGAVLMGLSLTGCPAGDDTSTSVSPDYGVADTESSSGGTSSTTGTTTGSTGTTDPGSTSFAPDYGVAETGEPTTGASSSSSGGSSTGDISTTTIGGPEYGLPETTSG